MSQLYSSRNLIFFAEMHEPASTAPSRHCNHGKVTVGKSGIIGELSVIDVN